MILTPQQIAEYTHAHMVVEPRDAAQCACGITWDSREVQPGFAYVALPGECVDGHSFVPAALRAGAQVALVMKQPDSETCALAREVGAAVLQVPSTFEAFTQLAGAWRQHLKATVIALTGSTGKTTTKNLVRDVLSTTYETVATKGNQNNELGVPRTLLEANPTTEYVVIEMGMRGFGQLEELCSFVKPDMALVTNTGECHIELLGSRENIARAKAEVLEALPDGRGIAVLNAADDHYGCMREWTNLDARGIQVLAFEGTGTVQDTAAAAAGGEAAVAVDAAEATGAVPEVLQPASYATDIVLDAEGKPTFTLHLPSGSRTCSLSLRGAHNVHNACAAAALGYACDVPLDALVAGLEHSLPEVGRQEVHTTAAGITVINDAYNANPDSMRASLTWFTSMEVAGKRYAVLGDMGELGAHAQVCHEGIGALIPSLSLDMLIVVGELARFIAASAQKAGYPAEDILVCETRDEALQYLKEQVSSGDAILIKASHSMELDRIAKGLLN